MKSTCASLLEATIYMFTSYRATISMCTSCSERVQNISVQQRGGLSGILSVILFLLWVLPDGMIDRRAMGTRRRRATACAFMPDLRYCSSMRVVLHALGLIRPHPKARIQILLFLPHLGSRRFVGELLPIIHDFIRESGVPHTIVPVFCCHLRL